MEHITQSGEAHRVLEGHQRVADGDVLAIVVNDAHLLVTQDVGHFGAGEVPAEGVHNCNATYSERFGLWLIGLCAWAILYRGNFQMVLVRLQRR